MAGILARRDVPEHMADHRRARHRAHRHGRLQPLPVRGGRGAARGRGRGRHREHRHRRPEHDPRRRQEPRRRRRRHQPRRLRRDPRRAQGTTGELGIETLRELATKAFHRTAHYDFVIANWFSEAEGDFPEYVMRDYEKVLELKYGENPHQRAAYYAEVGLRQHLLSQVTQLHGKQLGFNNLYDLNAARAICDEFTLPCVTIIKHNNPCGCALAENLAAAYDKAFACDPVERLRQRHRRQPHRGRAAGRAPLRAVRRGAVRAGLRAGGARDPPAQGRHPHPAQRGAAPGQPRRVRLQARHRRHPRAGQGRRHRGARRDDGGHQAPPERAGVGRPHLRLPRRQARQEQRHRDRQEPGDAWASAPAR